MQDYRIIFTFSNLLDKSITNFGYLISIRSQSLLVFAAPSAVLESLNNDRKKAISIMKEKMTYMELCGKKCSETEKIITYYQVASQLRSIVSSDKETQREFMKDSEIYIRLYVNALAKDYKSFLMIHGGDRPNDALIRDWKNLNSKSKEDFVRRSIQKIDEDPFIKKFRI